MADTLKIIDKAIEAHHHIQEGVKHAGDSLTDIEALFVLQKEYARWSQSSIQELKEKHAQLLQAVSMLEEGVTKHFGFEEKSLPPLLGDTLMKTVIKEHREIAALMEATKLAVMNADLANANQRELLAKKEKIQSEIRNLIQVVEEHSSHEENILKSIKKALEA